MASRRNHRAEMLLRIRRREEEAARRAFQEARGLADAAERQVARLRELLARQNDAARCELLGAAGGRADRPYRTIAGELLAEIAQRQADLQRHDQTLRRRRAELAGTITRRKAAEIVRRKLASQQSARAARVEAQQSADAHACRSAGGRIDGT